MDGQEGGLESDPDDLGVAVPFLVVAASGTARPADGELLGEATMEARVRPAELWLPATCWNDGGVGLARAREERWMAPLAEARVEHGGARVELAEPRVP